MQSHSHPIQCSRPIPAGLAVAAVVTCCFAFMPVAKGVDLLQENFDDMTLNPTVGFLSEVRNREAWTDQLPTPFNTETWSVDNSQMPAGTVGDNDIGVLEFEGWRVVDRDWWVQTSGGQGREEFVSSNGAVLVADPDEWDDFPNESGTESPTDRGTFDSTLNISGIDLQGIAANTARFTFFSSWRPEAFDDGDNTNNQSATIRAIYDDPGNTVIDVLAWDSDENSPNFKDDATNEFVNVPLLNPVGATSVTLEFRLFNAANDWWWAIDNLSMFDGDAPEIDGVLRLVIDRDTQDVIIRNNTGQAVDLRGYSIESANGTLDESAATYLADTDSNWIIFDSPTSSELSEGNVDFDTLAAGAEINLGKSWRQFYQDFSDISFEYSIEAGDGPQVGIVEFTGNADESFDPLDLNFDTVIDFADYQEFLDDYGSVPTLEGKLLAERYSLGDLNDDSRYSVQDFLEFQRQFEVKFGPGSFQALLATQSVPEPASVLLMACGVFGLVALRRSRLNHFALTLAILIAVLTASTEDAKAQLWLLEEDFETVVLEASPEEDPTQLAVWSQTFTGWTVDNSGLPQVPTDEPGDGVVDWGGWSFVDKDYWIDAAGDQTRALFTRGQGTVLVADPDEWDDDDPDEQTGSFDFYDAVIRSPVINIPASVPAGRIRVAFDSSWRPEGLDDGDVGNQNNQTATLDVIYNGSARTEILKYQSDPLEDNFQEDAQNEGIDIDAQFNGTATTMQLEFYLGNAWNDWWWAIDNVRVFVPAEPSILQVDVGTGEATLIGGDVINVDINSLDIQSANGNLNPAVNAGLSFTQPDAVDGADLDSGVGTSLGENWQLAAANENFFSEFFLEGSSAFTDSRSESLGQIFDISTPEAERDLVFTYTNLFGTEIAGIVEYVGTQGDADFNSDGDVDGSDFLAWQRANGTTGGTAFGPGDANGDGDVNALDLAVWQGQYGQAAALAASAAVPEPSSVALAILSGLTASCVRRRRAISVIACSVRSERKLMRHVTFAVFGCCVLLTVAAERASAVAPPPVLDRDYNFGENDTDNGLSSGTPISIGDQVAFARDSQGVPGGQQLIHMQSFNVGSAGPTYENVVGRPDGGTGIGVLLNGVSVFGNPYARKHYLRTGSQQALNLPIRSPSSTESDFGTGSIDYRFIADRGFQLWVQPANLPDGSDAANIVMDSNNHGVFLQNDGTLAMRYAGQDYTGVTQVTQDSIDSDTWYHLMVVRPFGPSSGSILYVDGVAEAAAFGTYLGEQDLTAEEVLPAEELDDSPLVIGSNTADDAQVSQIGQNSFFSGMVDDLEMFVMGFNNSADYGEFDFARDNKYAAHFSPAVDGDLTGDGLVTLADATIFADNWLFEKQLEWTQGAQDRSLRVGDLTTRAVGDFDYSGRVDLRDWEILNDQNPAMAAAAMSLINAVPEPSTLVLVSIAFLHFAGRSRRR
ncbi:MAG: PEP-CTERM sorting domain-containing protein [Planctomycetota bacterium]